MAIDLRAATEAFQNFIKAYDISDDQIRLKVVHTFAVKRACEAIARGLGLGGEDVDLAVLIGILHDVGRFEQLRQYHSFEDAKTTDHARLGIKMLFGDGLLRRFIADKTYDKIIYEAIDNHNCYAIRDGLTERELLHAKIIRDADKLDNYRVKLEDKVETMLGVTAAQVGAAALTDRVYDDARHQKSVLSATRKTPADMWLSYIAVTFDIYFDYTLKIILENEWIEKIVDRIEYTNADTKYKMKEIQRILLDYMKERVERHDKD